MDAPSKSCRNVLAEFIAIYKDLPQLWDTKCIGYTNRKAREEGYVIFLKRFRIACPTITIKDIKSKINTIRTNFRRELKKVKESDYNYVSSLWYFDNLRFLVGHLGLQQQQQQQQYHQKYEISTNSNSAGPQNFNLKISKVSSTKDIISNLNLSESIMTWCNLGTTGEADNPAGAEETCGTSPIKLNHDPEISSTNKSLQNLDDDSDDDYIEMPPIMSVKVEIPTTPEPDSEEQIQIQSIPTTYNTENSIPTLYNRPVRSTATAQNPVTSKPITRSALGKNIHPNPIKRAINPANRSSTTNPSIQKKIPSKKQNQFLRNRQRTTNNNQISSNHQERYSDTTEHRNEEISLKLNSRQNRKRKKEQLYTNYDKELFNSLRTHFKEKDDESDLVAQSWAMKLKRLQPDQRIFAEKFIGDIFMEAELGTLTRDSVKINSVNY